MSLRLFSKPQRRMPMYRVVRYVNGITETSVDSERNEKTFTDLASAQLEVKKLNLDLILLDGDVWRIQNI